MKWDLTSLERKVSISSKGAILLGKYVVCDGFEWDREVAIFSHIHSNHIVAGVTHFNNLSKG
jgi:hypothetical protein